MVRGLKASQDSRFYLLGNVGVTKGVVRCTKWAAE